MHDAEKTIEVEGMNGQAARSVRDIRAATAAVRALLALPLCALLVAAKANDPPPSALASIPLTPASSSPGPMLRAMPAAETGIDFVNVLRREHNIQFLNIGSGVAVGDVDGDGRPDLYLLSTDSPNRLYRQVAPFRFEDVTERAGVDGGRAWSRGAAFVDIDNDGDQDLYVCNTEAPNRLYINQGDGTFKDEAKAYGLDHVASSVMACFADYDRDGDLDMYLLTYRPFPASAPDQRFVESVEFPADTVRDLDRLRPVPDGGTWARRQADGSVALLPGYRERFFLSGAGGAVEFYMAGQRDVLFENDGQGKFSNVTERAGLTDYGLGLSATWEDLDGDGWLDLYVANDFETRDRLYVNNRDGTFTEALAAMMPYTTFYSMGADAADVNNDGRIDLFVSDMAGTSHYRASMLMDSIGVAADQSFKTREWPRQVTRNTLFLNTGGPRFIEIAHMAGVAASDWTWSPCFGDLDNDGWVDLFVSNGYAMEALDLDVIARTEKILRKPGPEAVARVLAERRPRREANLVFRNAGGLRFENVGEAWGVRGERVSYGALSADLDRDGDLDLVINNCNEPATLYRNDGTTGSRALFRCRGTTSNRDGIGALVTLRTSAGRQVRRVMSARGYMSAGEPVSHFGLADEESIDAVTVDWPSGHRQTFADLPAGRLYTITEPAGPASPPAAAAPAAPQFVPVAKASGLVGAIGRHRERAFDDYKEQPLLPGKLSQLGPGVACADADGDGDEDLFTAGAVGQAGSLLLNDGQGRFRLALRGPWGRDGGREDMAPLFFDVDADGDLDLYVSSGSVERPRLQDRLYLNDGSGAFSSAPAEALPKRATGGGAVAAADFDADGDLDLFVGGRVLPGRYPLAPRSALLRNDWAEKGGFTDVTDKLAPGLSRAGMVTSALWSDADGDARPDLLLTLEWGPIRLFRNAGGTLEDHTEAAGLAALSGWWNASCGADLDGDGDIDYIVLNAGLNTKYGAPTAAEPAVLYYGDMDGSGIKRLVEAKWEGGQQFPWRGRGVSVKAMPVLADLFPSYRAFASADLEDIYTAEALAEAEKFTANTLASGALVNDGSGRFQFRPLPRMAQTSPGFGVVAADFDADADTDVYFVQNLHSREPETSIWRSGLSVLLENDGRGGLSVAEPGRTGLVVPGDAKGLAVGDLNADGWADLVVAQNDGPLMAFRNRGVEEGSPLAVRLRGPRGNPDAVGARVTVVHADGYRHTAEVYAGSGYLSQSSAWLFFGSRGASGPQEIQVRWPDGRSSTHPFESTERMVIDAPGDRFAR